jgi:pimeloyl-ACP methyl ester carboxylesterase
MKHTYPSFFANNQGVSLHYYDISPIADDARLPLVVCPGLSETAEEYLELLETVLSVSRRRCIALSFRGRGKSDTPDTGYDLDEHISDIEAVVKRAQLESFHLLGYSRGVSYALGYALKHQAQVSSLLIGDYPPEHRMMPPEWPSAYINEYLIPFGRTEHIRVKAVQRIQIESTHRNLDERMNIPVFVARGLMEDSMIPDGELDRYRGMTENLTVREYPGSGHDLKETTSGRFYADIVLFLNNLA